MTTLELMHAIDNVLPQTQCRQCSYAGCLPYAQALAHGQAPINRCPPGGIPTLLALAELLKQDASPYLNDPALQSKPRLRALIQEDACIGCTKCLQACPVDAILGAAKKMHTVFQDECTGCGLCVPPCPVDCIDMIPIESTPAHDTLAQSNHFRMRTLNRQKRLSQTDHATEIAKTQQASLTARKQAIQEAIARTQAKRKTDDT